MRCPVCASVDDKVVDSRLADDGAAIRRRRECLVCGRRFTTFERAEAVTLWVSKRSGERVPYDRTKVVEGLRRACVNRPVAEQDIARVGLEHVKKHIVDDAEKRKALYARLQFALEGEPDPWHQSEKAMVDTRQFDPLTV